MDNEQYLEVSELERTGALKEAFELLLRLAENGHPLAQLDLSGRYFSGAVFSPPVFHIEPDNEKSKLPAREGQAFLYRLIDQNASEAMRMLGCICV